MTTPSPVKSPPCYRCGQPIVEAHCPDGRCPPRQNRRTGKGIVLAVLGAVSAPILSLVLAVSGHQIIPGIPGQSSPRIVGHRPDGPLQPMLLACKLFYRWKATHEPGLLTGALTDSLSPRVPEKFSSRLRGELDGLANWTRVAASVHGPKVVRREHAIDTICAR